jgi:hypothetical protein
MNILDELHSELTKLANVHMSVRFDIIEPSIPNPKQNWKILFNDEQVDLTNNQYDLNNLKQLLELGKIEFVNSYPLSKLDLEKESSRKTYEIITEKLNKVRLESQSGMSSFEKLGMYLILACGLITLCLGAFLYLNGSISSGTLFYTNFGGQTDLNSNGFINYEFCIIIGILLLLTSYALKRTNK